MNQITQTTHPILNEVKRFALIKPNTSLQEVLDSHSIDYENSLVYINDELVLSGSYDDCIVDFNDMVRVEPQVHGNTGSNAAVMIAILAVAWWAMPVALAGTWMATAYMGVAAVAAGLVANALFPPESASFDERDSESPTYSLRGQSNRSRINQPMPVPVGRNKMYPDLGAKPFTKFISEDQILYTVFNFGLSSPALSEIKIGNTPIGDYDEVSTSAIFPGNVDTTSGAELIGGADHGDGEWVERTSSANADELEIDITGILFRTNDKGQIRGKEIEIEAEYTSTGGSTWLPFYGGASKIAIKNASTAPIRKTYTCDVGGGQYDVRVRMYTKDLTNEEDKTANFTWQNLRTIQDDSNDYSHQTRLKVKIRASGQLNGTIKELNAIVTTPNADATSAGHSVSNPAWIFLYLARGLRDSAGDMVFGGGYADSELDITGITTWAAWCDNAGLECNYVFDRDMTVGDMLNIPARLGRAAISWVSGKLGVIYDASGQPVSQAFGMSNIKAGTFAVDYTSEKLAEAIEVSFINEDKDWQPDTVRKIVEGITTPNFTTKVNIPGLADKTIAGQEANLIAARQKYNKRRVTFETDVEGLSASRGNVISVSHDVVSWGESGRLEVGSTASALLTNRSVTDGDNVLIRYPDGTVEHFPVASIGDHQINVTGSLSPVPGNDAADYVFTLGDLNESISGHKMKVVDLEPLDSIGNHVRLTCIDEQQAYYDAINNGFDYDIGDVLYGPEPRVFDIEITEEYMDSRNVMIHITWSVENARGIYLRGKILGYEWVDAGEQKGNIYSFPVRDQFGETLRVTLTPLKDEGIILWGSPVTVDHIVGSLVEDVTPTLNPPDVDNLVLYNGITDTIFETKDANFRWNFPQWLDEDVPENGSDVRDENFQDFQVSITVNGVVVRTDYTTETTYTYSWEKNYEDGLAREFTISVSLRTPSGEVSTTPATLTVSNPAPCAPCFDLVPSTGQYWIDGKACTTGENAQSSGSLTLDNPSFENDAQALRATVSDQTIDGWTVEEGDMVIDTQYPVAGSSIVTIPNYGAETGDMSGWNAGTGLYYATTSSGSGSILPHSGSYHFAGGQVNAVGTCEFYSDAIDLSSRANGIDDGTAQLELDYWQVSYATNNDPGRARLRFYSDVEGTTLISEVGNAFDDGTALVWQNRVDTYDIPATTRSVRIVGQCNIITLSYASTYFDDFALTYIPLPPEVEQNLMLADPAMVDLNFAVSAALSGDTVVAGGTGSLGWSDDGTATFFIQDANGDWTQQQKITQTAGTDNHFGYGVAIEGDTAVVGAHNENGEYTDSGAVYIYTRSGTTWTQEQKLTPPSLIRFFGYSVDISGETIAIGAARSNTSKLHVYVYTRSGTTWTLEQDIEADTPIAYEYFGRRIALEDDTLIMAGGVNQASSAIDDKGRVYVFDRSGTTWTQTQILTASDAVNDDQLSIDLGISGDYIVAGANYRAETYTNQGAVYVFKNTAGTWSQVQKIVASDAAASNEYFGGQVAIEGTKMAVRKGGEGISGHGKKVYVYTLSGGTWGDEEILTPSLDPYGNEPSIFSSLSGRMLGIDDGNIVAAYSTYRLDGTTNVGMVTTFGTVYITEDTPLGLILYPSDGDYGMGAGNATTSSAVSDKVDLVAGGLTTDQLDNDKAYIKAIGDQASWSDLDKGRFGLRFYDTSQVAIGSDTFNEWAAPYPITGNWQARTHAIAAPSGARYAAIVWEALNTDDTQNVVFFDNFRMTYSAGCSSADVAGYYAFEGTTSGFTPSSTNQVYKGTNGAMVLIPNLTDDTVFVKAAAYDVFSDEIDELDFSAAQEMVPAISQALEDILDDGWV